MQTTSVRSGRLGESATSRTRVATLVTFSQSTLTGDPEMKCFPPWRKKLTLNFSLAFQMVLGGRQHKDPTDQPAQQAHLLEQVTIEEAGCYNTGVG